MQEEIRNNDGEVNDELSFADRVAREFRAVLAKVEADRDLLVSSYGIDDAAASWLATIPVHLQEANWNEVVGIYTQAETILRAQDMDGPALAFSGTLAEVAACCTGLSVQTGVAAKGVVEKVLFRQRNFEIDLRSAFSLAATDYPACSEAEESVVASFRNLLDAELSLLDAMDGAKQVVAGKVTTKEILSFVGDTVVAEGSLWLATHVNFDGSNFKSLVDDISKAAPTSSIPKEILDRVYMKIRSITASEMSMGESRVDPDGFSMLDFNPAFKRRFAAVLKDYR